MLKNGIFCEMVILVVFKGVLVVKNLGILIQIVPERPIYYYCRPPATLGFLENDLGYPIPIFETEHSKSKLEILLSLIFFFAKEF